jgi:hypothetical protein
VHGDDKGGGQPPGEQDSFDVSRRGGAAVAAELAAHMARLKGARAHKGTSALSGAGDAAAAPPTGPSFDATSSPSDRHVLPKLDTREARRIDRALRTVMQVGAPQGGNIWVPSLDHAVANGLAFKSLLAEGPNMNAIGMRSEWECRPPLPALDMLLRPRSRAVNAATRQLPVVQLPVVQLPVVQLPGVARPVVARRSMAASLDRSLSRAGARIATACSAGAARGTRIVGAAAPVLRERIAAMRQRARTIGAVARYAASDRLVASALAAIAVAIVAWFLVSFDRPVAHLPDAASARDDATAPAIAPPSIGAASDATEPTTGPGHLAARLKPELPWPSVAVRLKPAAPGTADADAAAPVAGIAPPGHGQAPHKRGDPRTADSILKQMFGAGQGLSRQPSHPSV